MLYSCHRRRKKNQNFVLFYGKEIKKIEIASSLILIHEIVFVYISLFFLSNFIVADFAYRHRNENINNFSLQKWQFRAFWQCLMPLNQLGWKLVDPINVDGLSGLGCKLHQKMLFSSVSLNLFSVNYFGIFELNGKQIY